MLKLADRALLDRVGMIGAYKKGIDYYKNGRVKDVKTNQSHDYFVANVHGSSVYEAKAKFNSRGEIINTYCDCFAFGSYYGDCKHIIALLLTIRDFQERGIFNHKNPEGDIRNILNQYRDQIDNPLIPVNLEVNFEFEYHEFLINLRIGEDKYYVVRNLRNFLWDLSNKKTIEFGKNFTYYPDIHMFNPKDKEIIDFLTILAENGEEGNGYHMGSNVFSGKNIRLGPKSLEKFLDIMNSREFNIKYYNHEYENIKITEEKLNLNFLLEENQKDLILKIDEEVPLVPITHNGKYFFYKDKVYKLSPEQRNIIMPLWNEMEDNESDRIRIDEELKQIFVSEILPRIKKYSSLSIDEKVEESIYSYPFQGTMYFDRKDHIIQGRVIFNYGDIEINPFSSKGNIDLGTGKILLRDMETERAIMSLLELGDFKVADGGFYLEEEEEIFDFLKDVIPQLQNYCEIYYSEDFKKINVISSKSLMGVMRLDSQLDMLEFDFNIDGIDLSQLGDVFKAIKEKKKYYKLKDGAFLSIDSREFHDLMEMLNYLNIDPSSLENGSIQIPRFRTMYLDKFIKDRGLDFIKKNVDFKRLVRDINEPDEIKYDLPKGLKAELRDYQRFGFKWLKTLANYGFGGILADEMGLGKTIQMITFLLSEKEEKGPWTNIVIVPTSLVYNWEEEVKKFAPSLKTLVVTGSKEERNTLIESAMDYDIIITSYPLIRRDIEEYRDIQFRYCILDEAQHIKNQNSINAKSVKNIKAKNYFALTGTPMENSLSELWSIFDFLMPGYLLSSKKFTETYERAISKENDKDKLKDLNNHIKPFILRRLKKEVLKELPDKIEQKLVVDMTREQKKIYLAYLQSLKGELNDEIALYGYKKSQLKILAGLTRLRQLCCHPSVFLEGYTGGSGKLDSLEEIVVEAISGGHRILIFSQFTTMLERIKKMLLSNNIDCLYLDGSTPMEARGQLVRDFNRGIGNVFLISLKAGGTGLNLTSADMVIHFDPWWNPAVEDQATDRAHRIGQENKVQVIKLITKGTIEEKIFQLQEQKKEMIDKVITEGQTLISKLSEEEIMSLFDV